MNKTIDKILGNVFDFFSFFAAAVFVGAVIAFLIFIFGTIIEILVLTPDMMRAIIKR